MLSCKETTHLLSESQDRKISLSERFQLEIHLAMCTGCTRYKQQIGFIRRACREFIAGRDDVPEKKSD